MFMSAWGQTRRSVKSDQVGSRQRDRSGMLQPPAEEIKAGIATRTSKPPSKYAACFLRTTASLRFSVPETMSVGKVYTGFGDHSYVTSQRHASFVLTCTCSGSASGVQSCDVDMYVVPVMSIVHALSEANVRVIGVPNRHELLDEVLLRPGRFDRLICIPLPGFACSTRYS